MMKNIFVIHVVGIHKNKNMIFDVDSWREKMGLNEELDERSKGKLKFFDKLREEKGKNGQRN